MGFDIRAVNADGDTIASFRGFMGAFRMLHQVGYDWFVLIDAEDCDGRISGTGCRKWVRMDSLERGLRELLAHPVLGRILEQRPPAADDDSDELGIIVYPLRDFMTSCINWCSHHGHEGIEGIQIEFE